MDLEHFWSTKNILHSRSWIYLIKHNHYSIRGVSNNQFKYYPSNRQRNVSINSYDSGLDGKNCGVSQGPVVGPLFFQYINDLNQAIKFCIAHYFADI